MLATRCLFLLIWFEIWSIHIQPRLRNARSKYRSRHISVSDSGNTINCTTKKVAALFSTFGFFMVPFFCIWNDNFKNQINFLGAEGSGSIYVQRLHIFYEICTLKSFFYFVTPLASVLNWSISNLIIFDGYMVIN